MASVDTYSPGKIGPAGLAAALASPVLLIFLSTNVVNAGNLAFNMLFSRWMGPELFADLATLMTIKLALLGILGALQMSVSHLVAQADGADAGLLTQIARINSRAFVALLALFPVVAALFLFTALHSHLGLGSEWALLILFASLPFTAPLSLLRGVVIGQLAVRPVILSANAEMGIRLAGGIGAWHAGLGLEGVVAAIALSIFAGWFVIRNELPAANGATSDALPVARAIGIAALPFAALQVAQVILLDGDVVLAQFLLSDTEAGYVAAFALFQRIQFFACFGLAAALLPAVASTSRTGFSPLAQAAPAGWLFLAVAIPFGAATIFAPEALLRLVVGASYLPAAPHLWMAGLASIAFTFSYLAATFLAGLGDRSGILAVIIASPLQVFVILELASEGPQGLAGLLTLKLGCQLALAALVLVLCLIRILSRDDRSSIISSPSA